MIALLKIIILVDAPFKAVDVLIFFGLVRVSYLVIDEELSWSVQALKQHQLIGLLGDSIRQRGPNSRARRPQPQAGGEGP